MDPARSDPAEHERLLRQQLLLAQVRIMEIEDERDAAATRIAELESLLSSAQRLADTKLDEAAHLARTLTDLQADHEALATNRDETERVLQAIRASLATVQDNLTNERALRLAGESRIGQLVAETDAIKRSRSWRWTAWLRALGQLVRRK